MHRHRTIAVGGGARSETRLTFGPSARRLLRGDHLADQVIERQRHIVFGHSHTPEIVPLKGGATYFNTGTWASHDAKEMFTHLMVVSDENGAPKAELRQWVDGASAPYRRS